MKLKAFEKMTGAEVLLFCLMAVCSGVMVGIGGTSYLISVSTLGSWGKLIGGILFSLGIFAIVSFDMKLFTGMVADIPTLGLKNSWRLPVCFICNAIGVGIVFLLVGDTSLAQYLDLGAFLIYAKLSSESWALSALASSILCGMLITISVRAKDYAPKKGLSATLGVVFPIVVFAFCGFDHSVANMLYFYSLGEVSWKITGYILLTILGNTMGGVSLPLIYLLRLKTEKKQKPVEISVENQAEEI